MKISVGVVVAFILLWISVAACASPFHSEPDGQLSSEVAVGAINYVLRDEMYAPLRYHATHAGAQASLAISHGGSHHEVRIAYSESDASTGPSNLDSRVTQANLSYDWLHRVGEIAVGGKPLRTFAGIGLASFVQIIEYGQVGGRYNAAWLAAHSMNLAGRAEYTLSSVDRVHFAVTMPMVAYVVRPPYAGFDEVTSSERDDRVKILSTRGQFEGATKYVAPSVALAWQRKLVDSWNLTLAYHMRLVRYDEPRPVRLLSNQFMLGLSYVSN